MLCHRLPPIACSVWIACAAICGSALGQEPERETILAWIADLGNSEFAVRDHATLKLNELTIEQLPLLSDQLQMASDPEVRVRLSGVVAKLRYERQQNIIKTFLRDPDPTQAHELLGWKSFSAVAGANRSSKRLFLELFDRYPELVEKELATANEASEAAGVVARRIQDLTVEFGQGEPVDGLALLYCLCTMDLHGDRRSAAAGLRVFGKFPYNQTIRDPQSKRPMEMMVERWALSLPAPSDWARAMLIMVESDLSTVRSVAHRLLQERQGPGRPDPEDAFIAFQIMFRSGKAEDLPVLESWLDCTDVCEERSVLTTLPGGSPLPTPPGQKGPPLDAINRRLTVEVRDAAVLACMRITGMEYRDYFESIRIQEPRGYLPNSILLESDEQELRQRRIDAWRATRPK